ncbi:hypothetical protein DFJ77DRAFT_461230 [Powellomyces hirtus]|nr:hypothetical protein DFJ77DRAFT_461230 [Powellomyces hirtus]
MNLNPIFTTVNAAAPSISSPPSSLSTTEDTMYRRASLPASASWTSLDPSGNDNSSTSPTMLTMDVTSGMLSTTFPPHPHAFHLQHNQPSHPQQPHHQHQQQKQQQQQQHDTIGAMPAAQQSLSSSSRPAGPRPRSYSDAMLTEQGDPVQLKRLRNTEAARRSRLRRLAHIDQLEARIKELETENLRLILRVASLETDRVAKDSRHYTDEQKIRQLEHQLAEAARFVQASRRWQASAEKMNAANAAVAAAAAAAAAATANPTASPSAVDPTVLMNQQQQQQNMMMHQQHHVQHQQLNLLQHDWASGTHSLPAAGLSAIAPLDPSDWLNSTNASTTNNNNQDATPSAQMHNTNNSNLSPQPQHHQQDPQQNSMMLDHNPRNDNPLDSDLLVNDYGFGYG